MKTGNEQFENGLDTQSSSSEPLECEIKVSLQPLRINIDQVRSALAERKSNRTIDLGHVGVYETILCESNEHTDGDGGTAESRIGLGTDSSGWTDVEQHGRDGLSIVILRIGLQCVTDDFANVEHEQWIIVVVIELVRVHQAFRLFTSVSHSNRLSRQTSQWAIVRIRTLRQSSHWSGSISQSGYLLETDLLQTWSLGLRKALGLSAQRMVEWYSSDGCSERHRSSVIDLSNHHRNQRSLLSSHRSIPSRWTRVARHSTWCFIVHDEYSAGIDRAEQSGGSLRSFRCFALLRTGLVVHERSCIDLLGREQLSVVILLLLSVGSSNDHGSKSSSTERYPRRCVLCHERHSSQLQQHFTSIENRSSARSTSQRCSRRRR